MPEQTSESEGKKNIFLNSTKNIFFISYAITATAAGLILVDFISQKVNSASGVHLPLIVHEKRIVQEQMMLSRPGVLDDDFVIDPHLGYAHAPSSKSVSKFKERYYWIGGFAIYSKNDIGQLKRPIILVMGGSTSDALWGWPGELHSWPEELSKILNERGISGTIVNGGTKGYSTSQEFLKLVRDGLAFGPDIIISYGGLNEGAFGPLPNPMVNPYQKYLLEVLTRPVYSPLLPNTIYLLEKILWRSPAEVSFTLGLPTDKTLGQQYEKNMVLMEAIAHVSTASFYGIIQPNAYVGVGSKQQKEERLKPDQLRRFPWLPGWISRIESVYGQIKDTPAKFSFVYSFTSILDGQDGVYEDDGIHTTPKADRIIAARVLELIYADLYERAWGARTSPTNGQ